MNYTVILVRLASRIWHRVPILAESRIWGIHLPSQLTSMPRAYAHYQVALKLLLKRGRLILFLRTQSGALDLPGGRIDNIEGKIPLEKILAREIREELGPTLRYKLDSPLFQFRRWVPMFHTYNLLTIYAGKYLRGDVRLSSEHRSFEWINPRQHRFRPSDFISPEEYRAFLRHFGRR